MNIETKNDLIEEILAAWKDRIGDDYLGYRGHVYRMFNFCLAIGSCTEEEKTKLAIAACFHDIGLWSAHTVDYIPPSVSEVKRYLSETGRQEWSEEIGLMVEMHHKARTYKTDRYPLVELFRKGDLVDFSLGFFKFGIPPAYVREVKKAIPNNGFHRFLMKGAREWFAKHPFSPPPFMKW
jgi:hypothetical protein